MALPRRPSKTTSPSSAPLSFPGVALSLFAAIAAGFVASRALKKRSGQQLPPQSTHLSSTTPSVFPALLRSLPNESSSLPSSPSSSFRFSNDDPVVEVVVRQEIARESQDEEKGEKIEEQSPVAKVWTAVAVDKDSITGPECSLRVNESNSTALEYNLEVEAPGQIDEDGVVRVSVEKIPESIEPQQGISAAAEARIEAIPVEEGRKESEEVGKQVVEATIALTSSVDVNSAPIKPKEGRKEQSPSEQSSVLVNGKTLESNSEIDSEEDHDELSNGSSLSDGTSCSVDSEGSLQEVTSAAVKPLDPCLEEGEADKVGAHCAEVRPSELDSSMEDCSAHNKKSNEQSAGDKAPTIGAHFFDQSGKELLLKVDFMLNSDENGGVALISPKFEVSIELPSNKQSHPIAHESAQVQEGDDAVTLDGMVISQPSDSKENSFQSDPEISAEGSAFHEFREAPQSTVATPNDGKEGTMAAENKQDSTFEIIDVEAEMEPLEESTDARPAMKTERNGESFNPGENLNGKQLLEKEENLQSEEELDRCSSSEDTEVRLDTESSARNEENRPEGSDTTNESAESSNNIDTEPEHLSSSPSFEQKVSSKEERQSDPQADGLSETLEMKNSDQEEKQQIEPAVSDQIFETEKLIVEKRNLSETFQRSRELSGDQMYASITGKESLLSTETPTTKLLKGMLIKFAGHIPLEMALICVLIGLLSTVLWFLRSTSVRDITGVTAHN